MVACERRKEENVARYSDVFLSDNNFDEELEKLCEIVGLPYSSYEAFTEKLDGKFYKQENENGFEEWINSRIVNRSAGISEATQVGQLAYEFGNGFIVLNFEVLV
jgi:hypothetical protein